ncbi:MAG: hypothetical protein ACRDYA_00445 [Egibacteraceae bacterium]
MVRRIAVLMTVLTLTSATAAMASPAAGCTLVGGHAEAAPKGSEGQRADAPTVEDSTGLCDTLAGLRGRS